jgi:hypothetical protein
MARHPGPKWPWLLVCLLAVAGCAGLDEQPTSTPLRLRSAAESRIPPPADFRNREALPACGSEHVVGGVGWDLAARQCLLDAFGAGRPAELVSTTEWEVGQITVEYFRSVGGGAAEIWVDTSGVREGTGWVRMIGCSFNPADEAVVGVRPTPVFSQSCVGPDDSV